MIFGVSSTKLWVSMAPRGMAHTYGHGDGNKVDDLEMQHEIK